MIASQRKLHALIIRSSLAVSKNWLLMLIVGLSFIGVGRVPHSAGLFAMIADVIDYESCDAVIVALGVRSTNVLREQLKDIPNVLVAGDAVRGGRRIPDAIHEAFKAAYQLV